MKSSKSQVSQMQAVTPTFRWKFGTTAGKTNCLVQIYMRQINPVRQADIDSEALAAVLRKRIEGEVRFDNGSRALYATDASNYRHVPIGVVIPRRVEDVLETIEAARRFDAPILARGGGTSLAGQCCTFGMVIDMSKYFNRIVRSILAAE